MKKITLIAAFAAAVLIFPIAGWAQSANNAASSNQANVKVTGSMLVDNYPVAAMPVGSTVWHNVATTGAVAAHEASPTLYYEVQRKMLPVLGDFVTALGGVTDNAFTYQGKGNVNNSIIDADTTYFFKPEAFGDNYVYNPQNGRFGYQVPASATSEDLAKLKSGLDGFIKKHQSARVAKSERTATATKLSKVKVYIARSSKDHLYHSGSQLAAGDEVWFDVTPEK